MNEIVLAVDLGGTNLRMAAIDREGRILFRTKTDTPRARDPREIVAAIKSAASECQVHVRNHGTVIAIAAAVPGTVNAELGVILNAPNVPALNGFAISAALEAEMNLTCFLENDANAAAVGENWLGSSRGFLNSICVTLGTGVGGGIIIEGKILRGADGSAGEIGHIGVEPFGASCMCGSQGCLEQYASATALVRLAHEVAGRFPESGLPSKEGLSSLDIFETGKQGDRLALEVFRIQGFYLGIALASLVNILNPEIIVIGGGAAAGWELFIPHVRQIVRQRAYREPAERAKIVRADCGDDAGILGAARLAFANASGLF